LPTSSMKEDDMNDRRLAQAEDEDHRAEQGELGEELYEFLHDAAQIEADMRAKPHPDFVCLKTAGTSGSEPDPK